MQTALSSHPFITAGILLSSLLFITLIVVVYKLHTKVNLFLTGSNGASLEETIKKLMHDVKDLEEKDVHFESVIGTIEKRLSTSLRKASILRYKAFEDNASTQSFSVALLDEEGNGTVISSLHVRDRVSIYAKKITNWGSEVELTEEEKEVIKTTKESQQIK